MEQFYIKKQYHSISPSVTKMFPFGLWFVPATVVFFTIATVYDLYRYEFDGEALIVLIFTVLGWVLYFIFRYQAYHTYFIFSFVGEDLILSLFNRKEVARYKREDVKRLYFKEAVFSPDFAPHLVAEFTDGRRVKFDREMAKYPMLVDEMENWTGTILPNKRDRLKNRDNEPLNPYYR